MITQVLHCPSCQGTDIVKHGLSPEGKQRYRCRACLDGRGRTFLLVYSYAGQSPDVKQQIVDMAMNASGIRDTARMLHVSPTTVLKELKKGTCAPAGESGGRAAPAPRTRGGEALSR
jgi:transposase-like protein